MKREKNAAFEGGFGESINGLRERESKKKKGEKSEPKGATVEGENGKRQRPKKVRAEREN